MLQKYLIEKIKLLKNRIETFTGYKYSQIQDSLTIGTLLTIITKLSSVIFIDYRIPILINLAFLLFYFLLSLKFNLVYYVRESLAYLLSVILGKRIQFREDAFCCIYYEEDAWRNQDEDHLAKFRNVKTPNDLSEIIYTYKKNPKFKYNFIEPTENIFNRFFQYICIFLIYIKLLTLKIPIIFYCIKTFLFFMLITNHLLPLTYIISIVLIFSRILLLLSDLTMDNIYTTYHKFKEQDSFWTGEYIEATTIPVNFNNACVFFIWAIRALEKPDRKALYNNEWFNGSFVKINEVMWNQKYFSKYKDLLINHEDKTHCIMLNIIMLSLIILNYKYLDKFDNQYLQNIPIWIKLHNGVNLQLKVILKNLNNEDPLTPVTNQGIKILDPKEQHFGYICSEKSTQTIYTVVSGTHTPRKTFSNAFQQMLKNKDIANEKRHTINGVVKAHKFTDINIFFKNIDLISQNIDLDPTRDLTLIRETYDNVVIDMELKNEYLKNVPGYVNADFFVNDTLMPSSPAAQMYNGYMIGHNIMIGDLPLDIKDRLAVEKYNIKFLSALLEKNENDGPTKNFLIRHFKFHKMVEELDFTKVNFPSHMLIKDDRGIRNLEELDSLIRFANEITNPKAKSTDFDAIAKFTGFNNKLGCKKSLFHEKTSQKYISDNSHREEIYKSQRNEQMKKKSLIKHIDDD